MRGSILIGLAIVLTWGAHAAAADVFVGTPPTNPATGESVGIELLVDVQSEVLGGYFFDFTYDPLVVHVTAVVGGSTTEFSSTPITNPATFSAGATPIAAVQGDLLSPTGFVSIAIVNIEAVGLPADSSDLDVVVNQLTNALAEDLDATVFPASVLVAIPEVPGNLQFDSSTSLSWGSLTNITTFNLYRGSLPGSGGLLTFDQSCLQPDIVGTVASDAQDPASGEGFFYLLAAERNGIEGPLGFSSNNEIRPNFFDCSGRQGRATVLPRHRPSPTAGSSTATAPDEPALPVLLSSADVTGDGRVDGSDVEAILEFIVGRRDLSIQEKAAADTNGDGRVDLIDAQRIKQTLRGGVDEGTTLDPR